MDETANNEPELTLEDSISLLIQQVPAPVQNFILHDLNRKTEQLVSRYKIHIDQGGVLQNELLLMLLGQENPADFLAALGAAGIPEEVLQGLITDINQEIFMKLRAEERNSMQKTTVPTAEKIPEKEWTQVISAPTPVPAPQPAPEVKPAIEQSPAHEFAPIVPQVQPTSPLAPKIQPQKTENRDALHAVLKEYGIDPYREPLE